MSTITENIAQIKNQIGEKIILVAVSKTKPNEMILDAYQGNQRVFGENKVQELVKKYEELPKDIEWHMIGHLQTNKVKYIAPFVSLIHGVESLKLLKEINKQAQKQERVIDCLLQLKVAEEETKFGMFFQEAKLILKDITDYKNIQIVGIMGMATNTSSTTQIQEEFNTLKQYFKELKRCNKTVSILSMGMSGDYNIAIEEGSTMVRIGSGIFGSRNI